LLSTASTHKLRLLFALVMVALGVEMIYEGLTGGL
jgi:uncharacterized membrane protein YfcA